MAELRYPFPKGWCRSDPDWCGFDVNQLQYSGRRRSQSGKKPRRKRSRPRASGGTVNEYSKGLPNLLFQFLSCSNPTREGGSKRILPFDSSANNNQCDCFVITHERELEVTRMSSARRRINARRWTAKEGTSNLGHCPGQIDAGQSSFIAGAGPPSYQKQNTRQSGGCSTIGISLKESPSYASSISATSISSSSSTSPTETATACGSGIGDSAPPRISGRSSISSR